MLLEPLMGRAAKIQKGKDLNFISFQKIRSLGQSGLNLYENTGRTSKTHNRSTHRCARHTLRTTATNTIN